MSSYHIILDGEDSDSSPEPEPEPEPESSPESDSEWETASSEADSESETESSELNKAFVTSDDSEWETYEGRTDEYQDEQSITHSETESNPAQSPDFTQEPSDPPSRLDEIRYMINDFTSRLNDHAICKQFLPLGDRQHSESESEAAPEPELLSALDLSSHTNEGFNNMTSYISSNLEREDSELSPESDSESEQ